AANWIASVTSGSACKTKTREWFGLASRSNPLPDSRGEDHERAQLGRPVAGVGRAHRPHLRPLRRPAACWSAAPRRGAPAWLRLGGRAGAAAVLAAGRVGVPHGGGGVAGARRLPRPLRRVRGGARRSVPDGFAECGDG